MAIPRNTLAIGQHTINYFGDPYKVQLHHFSKEKYMPAKLILRKKEYETRYGMTIRSALLNLDIQPEAILPTREGELVSEEEIIQDGDVIKLVSVVSRG